MICIHPFTNYKEVVKGMSIVYGGRTNYGQKIGIIMLDTVFPRIPGDVGNATTFDFPVRYKIVKGASISRVVKEADPKLIEPFIQAACELEKEGVGAIATSCGFLAIFQKELSAAVNIPVLSSSLLQVHMANAIINPGQKVGIITARATSLNEKHFNGVGINNIPFVVQGMEKADAFNNTFIEGNKSLDVDAVRKEMVQTALDLKDDNPGVGAIVLECTNMPPYAKDVQAAINLPVFDVVTLINYAFNALVKKDYHGYL